MQFRSWSKPAILLSRCKLRTSTLILPDAAVEIHDSDFVFPESARIFCETTGSITDLTGFIIIFGCVQIVYIPFEYKTLVYPAKRVDSGFFGAYYLQVITVLLIFVPLIEFYFGLVNV